MPPRVFARRLLLRSDFRVVRSLLVVPSVAQTHPDVLATPFDAFLVSVYERRREREGGREGGGKNRGRERRKRDGGCKN